MILKIVRNPLNILLNNNIDLINQLNNYCIKHKIIKWPYGVENAQITLDNYSRFTDVFSMLSSINFVDQLSLHITPVEVEENPLSLEKADLKYFPFYYSNLSAENYFSKYILPQFHDYTSFVRSAFFFLLETTLLKNKRIAFFQFIPIFFYILLQDISLSNLLIKDISDNRIVNYLTLEFLEGINFFFDEHTVIRICKHRRFNSFKEASLFSPFLSIFHFHFSKEFSYQCIKDCYTNKNIVPLLLALRIFEIQLASQREPNLKNKFHNDFENFQKFLIINELINNKFLDVLLKKYNYNKQNSQIKLQVIGLSVCGTFATILSSQSAFNLNTNASNLGLSSLTTVQQIAKVKAQNQFLQIPKSSQVISSQRNQRSWVNKISKGRLFGRRDKVSAVYNSLFKDEPLLNNHTFTLKGVNYEYQTFELDGKNCWSPYGLTGSYRQMQNVLPRLTTYVDKFYPNYSLFGEKADLDHIQKTIMREALNISEEEGQVVVVPKKFNPIRTNNRYLVDEFTNFDYRVPVDTPKSEINIRNLFLSRQRHALARTQLLMSKNGPKVSQPGGKLDLSVYDIVFNKIENGYQEATQNEYKLLIANFCAKYRLNPSSIDSYLAFNDKMLLNGMQKDLNKAKNYIAKYKTASFANIITPNHFIKQIISAVSLQNELGKSFQLFIQNPKYCEYSESEYKQFNKKIQSLLFDIIQQTQDIKGFSKNDANADVIEFSKKCKKNEFSTRFTWLLELQIYINGNNVEKFELGNFYKPQKDQLLDLTLSTAKKLTAQDGIERVILIKNETKTPFLGFEIDDFKEQDPYIKKITQQTLRNTLDLSSIEQEISKSKRSESNSFKLSLFKSGQGDGNAEGRSESRPGTGSGNDGDDSDRDEGPDGDDSNRDEGPDGDDSDRDEGPGGDDKPSKDDDLDLDNNSDRDHGSSRDTSKKMKPDNSSKTSDSSSAGKTNNSDDTKRYGPPTLPAKADKIPAYR